MITFEQLDAVEGDAFEKLAFQLLEERDELLEQIEKLKDEIAELNEADDLNRLESALQEVREWFDRVLLHKLPMTDPRRIVRIVEDAL